MKLLEQLYRWRNCFRRNGEDPAFIPLTAEEIHVIVSDCRCDYPMQSFPVYPTPSSIAVTASKFYGCDIFESPFATEMRARQIELPVTQLDEAVEIPTFQENRSLYPGRDRERLALRLTAHICHDTTQLKLTFEWDVLAKFKRALRITKWFPVKTRTVRIDGRVLYPYLKIALPHNRHHATFRHVQ